LNKIASHLDSLLEATACISLFEESNENCTWQQTVAGYYPNTA